MINLRKEVHKPHGAVAPATPAPSFLPHRPHRPLTSINILSATTEAKREAPS